MQAPSRPQARKPASHALERYILQNHIEQISFITLHRLAPGGTPMKLLGKTAIVTGASSGMGR
ncbi:MAG: hypothetical protein KBB43_01995, partial [Brachymonas sp.]|nr:hypothetical protein [Brachymonas sp.]MBP7724578.1 hypothetical protein [Brachymonas sp.]